MLAVFYPAISNLCYCLSENVPGIVYQVLFRKKKKRGYYFLLKITSLKDKYSRVRTKMFIPSTAPPF